jgi:hypothetical protein
VAGLGLCPWWAGLAFATGLTRWGHPCGPWGRLPLASPSGIGLVFHKNRMWWVRGPPGRHFSHSYFFQELNI